MTQITQFIPASHTWADATTSELINFMERRIEDYGSMLPLQCVPFSTKTYFSPVENVFPGIFDSCVFLGQLLMEPNDRIEGFKDEALIREIKKFKAVSNVKEAHCIAYGNMRKMFHRRSVLTMFDMEKEFFAAVGKKAQIKEGIVLTNHTQIGEKDYRAILHVVGIEKELITTFIKLHLHVFLGWIRQQEML